MDDATQMVLGEGADKPTCVCRSNDQAREEVQANAFASFLLMPRALVRREWCAWRGRDDVMCVLDLDVREYSNDRRANQNSAMQKFCKPIAERFHVSAEAMSYRLEALGLLTRERSLFG